MDISETQMYGTSRSSYLRMEHARMIVRHKSRIDDSKIGARGRCVESVFIENAAGERSLMPTTNLLAGRAMTQHVNQSGGFADPVGQQITSMAEDYSNLRVGSHAAIAESAVREACRNKMGKLRKTFERLARPMSYAAEAAALEAQGKVLNETNQPIADSRIDELRQLLNGEQTKEVYESCCKALDEMRDTVNEIREAPTVRVVGHPVSVTAWDAFKQHVVNLKGQPHFGTLKFPSVIAEIAYRLHQLVSVVQDDSMANLLDFVAERLPEETDAAMRDKYRLIAVNALRAVNAMPTPLVAKNPTVVEHVAWLNRFDPDRLLMEYGSNHGIDPMDPGFSDEAYERAEEMAITDFDGEYFIESPEMQDMIGGRDPHDPDENEITKDEIVRALKSYLRHYIETYNPEFAYGYNSDTEGLVPAVYDKAAAALHQRGFVVAETNLAEALDGGDLTSEDVLLPAPNQGADLKGEVTKTDITNPDDPSQHGKPNTAYTSRLMTLAGVRSGV